MNLIIIKLHCVLWWGGIRVIGTNRYLDVLQSVVNHTGISNCWLCGQIGQDPVPLLGIPASNWTNLNPYELFNSSYQCLQKQSPLGTPPYTLELVNETVTIAQLNDKGKYYGELVTFGLALLHVKEI